jgi:N utilization substance protein B
MEISIWRESMSRKLAREAAMKLVYQMDMNSIESQEVLDSFFENSEEEIDNDDKVYIVDCVSGVKQNIEYIDAYIEKYLKGWKMNRISKVDLAIMRLSVYEMTKRQDVPNIVAVNEAIELAKKFSGEKSSVFVNGILGRVIEEVGKND